MADLATRWRDGRWHPMTEEVSREERGMRWEELTGAGCIENAWVVLSFLLLPQAMPVSVRHERCNCMRRTDLSSFHSNIRQATSNHTCAQCRKTCEKSRQETMMHHAKKSETPRVVTASFS